MRKPTQNIEDVQKIVNTFIPAKDEPAEDQPREKRGRGRPKERPENLSSEEIRVLLPARAYKAIDRIIAGTGNSKSAYIRGIVTDHLKKIGEL